MLYDGHKVYLTNGYYDVYFPQHPNARKNGMVMLQVLEAEKILGRSLSENECVHHKDFNKLNNSLDNLMIFASNRDHQLYHRFIESNVMFDIVFYRVGGVWHCKNPDLFFNGINPIYANGVKLKPCPKCGKMILVTSKLCLKCRGIESRKIERPTRGELKTLIKTKSFSAIGRMFNTSDNTIRKWCKSYGLPYKSSVIKNMSSKDWKYI